MQITKQFSAAMLAMLLAAVMCQRCHAEPSNREYSVKAAFIYNFTQFIEWPDDAYKDADDAFVVGVIGDSPITAALTQALAEKFVGNHPILVKRFESVDTIGACQVLFVPGSLDSSMPAIVASLGKSPCLTIGEGGGFMAGGGGIQLFLEDSKMKFLVHPEALENARLKASAKLMKLARIYKR